MKKEEEFMLEAIADAKKNKHHFGAVVVKGEKIISKAGKRPVGDPRYHAETQAIMKATKKLKSKHLKDCVLYSTCEPCPMCFYMAWITHIPKIVYGASQKDAIKAGFEEIDVDDKELDKKSGNRIKLVKGVMKKECLELFEK
ncbi:tRNA-specific adenosine deaminase [uncultured archaeon]|nr:tRNA-specific adenosine deaminase [uncultured archaeon]